MLMRVNFEKLAETFQEMESTCEGDVSNLDEAHMEIENDFRNLDKLRTTSAKIQNEMKVAESMDSSIGRSNDEKKVHFDELSQRETDYAQKVISERNKLHQISQDTTVKFDKYWQLKSEIIKKDVEIEELMEQYTNSKTSILIRKLADSILLEESVDAGRQPNISDAILDHFRENNDVMELLHEYLPNGNDLITNKIMDLCKILTSEEKTGEKSASC